MLRILIKFIKFILKILQNVEKSLQLRSNMCYTYRKKKAKEVKCMYNVLDICRYVINYSNKKNYGISNLKLQKILYFIQAYFLTYSEKKEGCFKEKIEAWDFGPVVREAYKEYKQYGSCNIPLIDKYYEIDNDSWDLQCVSYSDEDIRDTDKQHIQFVVDKFSDYSANDLVELTHNQDPWINAYEPYMNNEITHQAIKEYFGND